MKYDFTYFTWISVISYLRSDLKRSVSEVCGGTYDHVRMRWSGITGPVVDQNLIGFQLNNEYNENKLRHKSIIRWHPDREDNYIKDGGLGYSIFHFLLEPVWEFHNYNYVLF